MIFVDTSALVALFDRRDAHHARATRTWATLVSSGAPLVLTSLVVVETVTLLRRRAGFEVARTVGERLFSGSVGEIVHVGGPLLDAAWVVFRKYADHDLSLTDCATFALMRARRISRAFAYDADFKRVGLATL